VTFLQSIITWLLALWARSPVVPITSPPGPGPQGPPEAPTGRALITRPEQIGARFHDTGSEAWKKQWKGTPMEGQHGGVDFHAAAGSPVYAPYAMRVIAVSYYPDSGRLGWYIIGTLADGVEYYSGHLGSVNVVSGNSVTAGDQIGVTNEYAHTHIQMKRKGILIDPEAYLAAH